MGGIKWVDLCLYSKVYNAWCWFEFKVRHAENDPQRRQKAAFQARDVFRKDVVALMGFDAQLTADTWVNPDSYTKAYWFKNHLKPDAQKLCSGQHHFVAVFLQLGGQLNREVWSRQDLLKEVDSWKAHRCKQAGRQLCDAGIDVAVSSKSIMNNYWLIVLEWS